MRADVTYPGDPGGTIHKRTRPPCSIPTPGTKDTVWIPEVARQGWLAITRDSSISAHRAEIEAVRVHGAKTVALAGDEARGTWAQLEVLLCRWRDIEALTEEPGPFIYSATRTRLRRVPL